MKIYEIIEMLCKEKGITITQMCKEANVSRGSMTDLKMGRSTTLSLPTTTKLCDYFNVSTDFLLGKQDIILGTEIRKIIKQIANELGESYDELEKLYMTKEFPRGLNYKSLLYFFSVYLDKPISVDKNNSSKNSNNVGQDEENEQDKPKKQEETNISQILPSDKIYKIPVFASVSAGFGAYAEENVIDFLPIVIENPYDVPDMLGIRVHGNSMYPKIEDGDVIVVRKQESVDSGDIAVIMIDGEEGVVKKVIYGDDWIELHSINPEYMPRRFEGAEVERLRVVGLVKGTFKTF